jgi:hypothetical protein
MKAEARLQKIMARCADLLDEDQFNELDAMARATDPTPGGGASVEPSAATENPEAMYNPVARKSHAGASARQIDDMTGDQLQSGCTEILLRIQAFKHFRDAHPNESHTSPEAEDAIALAQMVVADSIEIKRLQREWERECSDGDAVLHHAGLTPDDYRTDGGSINVPKVARALLVKEVAHRTEAERLQRELAEAQAELAYARSTGDECAMEVQGWKRDAARYRWLRASYERAPPGVFHPAWGQYMGGNQWKTPEQMDAAIDAAMQEGER